jgi:hypothetical protein
LTKFVTNSSESSTYNKRTVIRQVKNVFKTRYLNACDGALYMERLQ